MYYSPGPTRTQTVISKSNRGYGTGTYDIAVTGRFSSANATASVTGYFIKPQVTALECTNTAMTSSALMAGFRDISVACTAGYTATGGSCDTSSSNNAGITASSQSGTGWRCESNNYTGNAIAYILSGSARCCRTPGRS